MKNFEELLQKELDKLPYTKHLDDGQYNDGKIAGFELGARWVLSLFAVSGCPCFTNQNKIRKLFKYLFKRPDVKVGDKLSYYNKTCMHIYFSWKDGLWFIECEDVVISWGLEQFYRKRNQDCT